MLKLGMIGTNVISESFYQAAMASKKYQAVAVYSRKQVTGEKFCENKPGMKAISNWGEFLNADLDVIYIASPNSIHFKQAKACLEHGMHIIVEKPAFSTPEEMNEIITLANQKKKMYFEAARHMYEPGFIALKEILPNLNQISGANFTYGKYSSRYDNVLNGEVPNIFSPEFSGGALMDLGVYLVYTAVSLFGMPKKVTYYPTMISTGVDGKGTGILSYDDFNVVLNTSKIDDSFLPSEIYGENQTITLPSIQKIKSFDIYHRKAKQHMKQEFEVAENPMVYEAKMFAEMLLQPKNPKLGEYYQEMVELSRNVNLIVTKLRLEADITFAADHN